MFHNFYLHILCGFIFFYVLNLNSCILLFISDFFSITKSGIWMCYAIVRFGIILHTNFGWALGWNLCFKRRKRGREKKKEGGRNALQLCEDKKEKKRKGGNNQGMSVELRDAIMVNFKLFWASPKLAKFGRLGGSRGPRRLEIRNVRGPMWTSFFIFQFFSKFPNLGCKFGTNLNLPTFLFLFLFHLKKLFVHNLDVRFFIQGFHRFIFKKFLLFFSSNVWMNPFVIFDRPYLMHMSSNCDNFCIIGFVLASSMQQWAYSHFLEIVILGF